MSLSRKLAVILHADVVGSTSLVQQGEMLAHERMRDAFRRLSAAVETYDGITHEIRGDALVAEFARVSDAASAGLAFLAGNADVNARLGDELIPRVRIGISLGEVVIADGTVTGAGVVLAQRVEQLAAEDGACVTGAVHEAMPRHLPFDYSDLGKRDLKGFEEPVQVYAVSVTHGRDLPGPAVRPAMDVPSRGGKRRLVALVAGVVGLAAVGLAGWHWRVPEVAPASIERMAFPLPDKPSIAVLPFNNMSDDPQQEYFTDGMTEDLITDLSKLSGLFVISRNSTFTYKGRAVEVRQAAEELGVRYVLEGSVRRAGQQVRINAQLIDATTGGHLWADRYDGALDDVFALQDDVTRAIVAALALELTPAEEAERNQHETDVAAAYDAFLEGWAQYRVYTPQGFANALGHFERALALDPAYGRAHAAAALVRLEAFQNWWYREMMILSGGSLRNVRREVRARADRNLQSAARQPTPLYHRAASLRLTLDGRYDEAVREAERGIALNPNDSVGYEAAAAALVAAGRAAESFDLIRTAQRLDPRTDYRFRAAQAEFGRERYDRAAALLEVYTRGNRQLFHPFLYLSAAYGHLGRADDARAAFDDAEQTLDRYSRLGFQLHETRIRSEFNTERLVEGLRKAGIVGTAEVVEASPERITIDRPARSSVQAVYDLAKDHCHRHGKKSYLLTSASPRYIFGCE